MIASPATAQFLTFFVGGEKFAVAAADVAEVFRRPRITRVPNSPPSLLGVAGLRGVPAPVISLARLMGREDAASDQTRLLLMAGDDAVGLAVDRVGALTTMPLAEGEGRRGFGRLYLVEDAALRMLDVDALIRQDFAQAAARPRRTFEIVADAEMDVVDDRIALLGFALDGQAYALPLDEIDEVLPFPAELSVVAQSDDAALGVMDLRGQVLPIVSLRFLLGLAAPRSATQKVVVARIGDSRVGLAVDRLTAILRAPTSTIDPAPAVLNRGVGTAQVEAICRLPEGQGLVAILSIERLFSDAKTAQILADGRTEAKPMTSDQEIPTERFVIFRLGSEEYGLPLAAVDEVARLPEKLTRVPNAPAFIEGVLNLRDKVTPIIDQRRRFDSDPDTDGRTPRIVVTTVDGRQAGFIVDAVAEILPIPIDRIEETSPLTADAGRLFTRIATLDGGERLILIVEPKELLDRAERDLLAELDSASAAK